MTRIAITTLGCKVNQYDSAALAAALAREGYGMQGFEPGADVYILNSCTVTERADAETRRLARRVKRWNPTATVILTGCYAQASPAVAAALPEVDFVVGLDRRADLLRVIDEGMTRSGSRVAVSNLREARIPPWLGAEMFDGRTRAFLKVQDGCDLFCSFCIVPRSRGRSRSVPPHAVLSELERLAAAGFQEVVLTGIHLGGWGHDLQPRLVLADLLEMIAARAPVPRLRLSSIDPPEVSGRLLEIMRRSGVICPHLHLPLQSGDDAVLRRMHRRYDVGLVREVVGEVRRQLPDAGLGTDLIAGFPGETEEEFASTLDLVQELPFTYFHVFPYSKRVGTRAAKLPGQLPKPVITLRARRLRKLGERKRAGFAARFVGATLRVLAEDDGGLPGRMGGYSRNYVRVMMPAGTALANREVRVRVHAVRGTLAEGLVEET